MKKDKVIKKKIMFDGFRKEDGNYNREAQVILDLLSKYYTVELSDTPDYIFCNVDSRNYYKYDGVRIFCTIEAICPDFNLCDYGIGFEYLEYGDRYLRFPNFCFYPGLLEDVKRKHNNITSSMAKRGFCSFVYSNSGADAVRGKLYRYLSEYKTIDSGGRYMNNQLGNQPVDDKLKFESEHKFSIACENASHPGYHTEKLAEAFAAQTIPIYWGDPHVEKVFNEKAFINCNKYNSLGDVVERVVYLDTHDEEYLAMLREPAFIEDNPIEEGKKILENYLVHIFDQPLEQAYRRNRGFWGRQYLQTIRNDSKVVERYLRLKDSLPGRMLRKLCGKQ